MWNRGLKGMLSLLLVHAEALLQPGASLERGTGGVGRRWWSPP